MRPCKVSAGHDLPWGALKSSPFNPIGGYPLSLAVFGGKNSNAYICVALERDALSSFLPEYVAEWLLHLLLGFYTWAELFSEGLGSGSPSLILKEKGALVYAVEVFGVWLSAGCLWGPARFFGL